MGSSYAYGLTSPDPLLNAGRPDNPQTWNKYAYTLNNPLKYTDPTGLYEWSQKCGDDDAQCQANRQQFRDALATIRNAANQYEEGSDERNKLEAVLDKSGDEGEKNKVSIKFGEAGGFPAQESTSLFGKKTITFDMKMLGDSFRNSNSINPDYKPSIGWGEVVAHEGAHMLDRFAFGNPVNGPALCAPRRTPSTRSLSCRRRRISTRSGAFGTRVG